MPTCAAVWLHSGLPQSACIRDDYEDMIMAGFINGSTTASLFRPISDSSLESRACYWCLLCFSVNAPSGRSPTIPSYRRYRSSPAKPLRPVPILPKLDISYGEGDCAPQYENGTRGTCINGKPCNGFGFKDADGKIQCACFEKVGCCEVNQGCSLKRRACVAQREIDRISPARQR